MLNIIVLLLVQLITTSLDNCTTDLIIPRLESLRPDIFHLHTVYGLNTSAFCLEADNFLFTLSDWLGTGFTSK